MNQVTPTQLAEGGAWTGTRLPGHRFTEQQKAVMIARRGSADGWDVRIVEVQMPRERTEAERMMHRPREQCHETVTVGCPIVNRGDRVDTVIAPGGDIVRVKSERRKPR